MTSDNRYSLQGFGSAVSAALLLLVWAAGCSQPEAPYEPFWEHSGPIMGTQYTVKVVGAPGQSLDHCEALVHEALEEVNGLMSTYSADSELSRFNQHQSTEAFPMSPLTLEVVELAEKVSEASGGAFDVTIGPLVNAWGFGPDDVDEVPSDEAIAALLETVGHDQLVVDTRSGTLAKERPDLYVDLSAIAKGYAVDRAAEKLLAAGHDRFMLEVGGEVRTSGTNHRGTAWGIAIEKPLPGQRAIHRVVPMTELAMATSGDYRNFVVEDGQRRSHILDPRTGRPAEHRLVSVTVLDPSCAVADAWATAFMTLGEDEGYTIAEQESLAALFLYQDGDSLIEKSTPAFEARANPQDPPTSLE